MKKMELAIIMATGALFVSSLRAEELSPQFDQGVDIAPIIEDIQSGSAIGSASNSHTREDQSDMVWVAMENMDAQAVRKKISLARRDVLSVPGALSLFPVQESEIKNLSAVMHERRDRCGGFFAYSSREEAIADNQAAIKAMAASTEKIYAVTQPKGISSMIGSVRESNLRETIKKLMSFESRYYKSDSGVASSNWIASRWKQVAGGRSDIAVELFQHTGWPQPSVIATITGSEEPEKVVVLGGHADSISGWGGSSKAPGADDNASGIAVLTETLRIIASSGHRPARTIKFIAYAAEEVGLRGSREIAADFAKRGVDVQGVIQFDMTSFNGSDKSIYFIADHTSAAQNAYLGQLVDTYIHVPWGETKCGYACSDHASWTRNGYPASFPFEATKSGANSNIHSARDTLASVGGTADHAVPFAKLAVAFLVETGKATSLHTAAASGKKPDLH